jgi:hypothetical protein
MADSAHEVDASAGETFYGSVNRMVEESRPKSPTSMQRPLNSQERARNGAIFFARNIVCGIKAAALPCTSAEVPDDFISGLLAQDMDEVAQQFLTDLDGAETNRILNAPMPEDREPNIFSEIPEHINLLLYAQKRFGKYSEEYAKTKELFRKFYEKTGDSAWINAVENVDKLPDTGFSIKGMTIMPKIKALIESCDSAIIGSDGTVTLYRNGTAYISNTCYIDFRQLSQLPNLAILTIENQCVLNDSKELIELVGRSESLKSIFAKAVTLSRDSVAEKVNRDGVVVDYTLKEGQLISKNGEPFRLRKEDIDRIREAGNDRGVRIDWHDFIVE